MKLFLVVFYTLMLLNYSHWYRYLLYLNDVPALVIEFCCFVFVPTGILLLPNQREHEPIDRHDPDIKSISLSGFDDEETQL